MNITPANVNQYLAIIRINFENSYKTQTPEERQLLIQSWYEILKDYPKEVCDKAVINALKYAKFAPRIGDIVEQIDKMMEAFEKTENELWSELCGVLREVSSNYYAFRFNAIDSNGKTQGDNARDRVAQIFNNLSPELREYVQTQRGLIEIAGMDGDKLNFEKARFIKALPRIRQSKRTRQELPEKLAKLIQSTEVKLLGGE